ncbi:TetR/AcrR family transcriptional regulator [Mesorhizobium shangrilense]|uniref:Helix-turn-helix domain-containing protein n=1 Tax=Mesorhizobium shangrilense TaxID=460060 RepID=A0ABV2DGZ9_9HYPH
MTFPIDDQRLQLRKMTLMPSTGQPKTYLSANREKQIVEKAIEYFSENGFSASTREIAKHTGVTQSLLYRYFKTKGDIVDRAFNDVFLTRWKGEWQVELQNRAAPFVNGSGSI